MKKILVLLFLGIVTLFAKRLDYDENSTCLVRHVKIAEHTKWACEVILKDNQKFFFSSPKSMLEFYLHPGRWADIGIKSEDDFKEIYATDYKTQNAIDAKKAFFVYGSNVISIAGDDLVVFEKEADAKEFASKHNGKRVLPFNQVKLPLINLLNGKI